MISNRFEDYEVLSILGGTLQSTCYKVKCKRTSTTYVWRAVNCTNLDIDSFYESLKQREQLKIPHLVEFYKPIHHKQTETIYVITEFIENSLHDVIHKCRKDEFINEGFLWYMLHSILTTLKKINSSKVSLSINNIFIDKQKNIKILYFNHKNKNDENCIKDLGIILQHLCGLTKIIDKSSSIPNNYSDQLRNLIDLLIHQEKNEISIVDSLLFHPTILKSAIFQEPQMIYLKKLASKCQSQSKTILENLSNHELENAYTTRLQNLQNKESALKNFEEKLKQKEYALTKREKKISLTERIIKEKMVRAELYLKRCKESKTNIHNKLSHNKKLSQIDLDTSFSADCGDTSILPTSKKINATEIIKPSTFSKNISERKIKFKGHSPLRTIQYTNTIHFNRHNKSPNNQKFKEYHLTESKSDKENCTTETDSTASQPNEKRSFSVLRSIRQKKSKKPLFKSEATSNEDSATTCSGDDKNVFSCRSIAWSEEHKRHAFDLLRILNSTEDLKINTAEIKHTYL